MCGIIGIVGKAPVAERLVDGLRRMEYRGYDSAGICTLHDGRLVRRRAEGKLANLVLELERHPAPGEVGIAHTRWATHGAPTAHNAHPHATDELALVHNGIIENFRSLREALVERGRTFESETDTEIVAHLVSEQVEAGKSPEEAVREVLPQLRGAFALAIAFRRHPEMLIGARLGSPLVVGYGEGETYLGSDALALAPLELAGDEMGDDFGVGLAEEGPPVGDQLVAQRLEILDDAVVDQRDVVGRVRVRVVRGRRAVRRPAGVRDADRARRGMAFELRDQVGELAFGATTDELAAVDGAHAGAVVTAIFHPPQPVDQPVRDLFSAGDADDSAHRAVSPSKRIRYADSRHVWRKVLGVSSNEHAAADQSGGEDDRVRRTKPTPLAP